MMTPNEKHRAWAEILRTAAAITAALATVFLVGAKLGWW